MVGYIIRFQINREVMQYENCVLQLFLNIILAVLFRIEKENIFYLFGKRRVFLILILFRKG